MCACAFFFATNVKIILKQIVISCAAVYYASGLFVRFDDDELRIKIDRNRIWKRRINKLPKYNEYMENSSDSGYSKNSKIYVLTGRVMLSSPILAMFSFSSGQTFSQV